MRQLCIALAVLIAVSATALGDDGDSSLLDELRSRHSRKEDKQDDPSPVVGVRYRVALHTGRVFYGIRRGPLYVRWQSGAYAETEPDAKGAGVRLYFPRGQNGFVVIRMGLVSKVEEVGEISVKEGVELSRGIIDLADRAETERAELRAQREQAAADAEKARLLAEAKAAGVEENAEEAVVEASKLAKFTQILVRFPPGTWTLETPDEIARRRVILGIAPTEEDMAFLEVFDAWTEAYAAWKLGQETPNPAPAQGEKKTDPKDTKSPQKTAAAADSAAGRPAAAKDPVAK